MVKKSKKGVYSADDLKGHKKGKDYVAKRLAEQETLNDYDKLDTSNIPSHLDYYAKKEWERVVPLLNQLPIAELDRQLVESYCTLHAAKRRLEKDIQDNGISYAVTDREGNNVVRKNPSYELLLSTIKELRMMSSALGMTMSSRLDLAIPDEEQEEDEVLKLLKGG